jgi:hypothetical protein
MESYLTINRDKLGLFKTYFYCLCHSVWVRLPNLSNGIFVAFIPSG